MVNALFVSLENFL